MYEKHGKAGRDTKSPAYRRWANIKQRCTNPNNPDYKHYGGRGIKMCARWLNSFTAFYKDVGDAPKGMTIDRKNNNGDYEPSNVRWVPQKIQTQNTQRAHMVRFMGLEKNLADWCRIYKMLPGTYYFRRKQGWSIKKTFLTPVGITGAGEAGRRKTHCLNGHPFNEENTYRHNGKRQCKQCKRERKRK